jgi:predicted SnoaL-like aldol condensation-catalyzing enzyme
MGIKENKELIRYLYERINQGDMGTYYEHCDPGYIEHLTTGDLTLEQSKQLHIKGGPTTDSSVTINDMVAERDKVAVLVTFRWTQKNTGKKTEMTNANIFRISKGKLMEGWNVTDVRAAELLPLYKDSKKEET